MKFSRNLGSCIWKFLRPQKGRFFLIFLLSFIWSLDIAMGPYLFGKITDVLGAYDGDRQAVWSQLQWLLLGALALWIAGVDFCRREQSLDWKRTFG